MAERSYDFQQRLLQVHRPNRRAEKPLGEGSVDFGKYLTALREIGYDGYLTIEREVGANPSADIAAAVKFLDEYKVR